MKAQGRVEDAIPVYEAACRAYPSSAVAQHNLAATLGDAARYAEAEKAARQAMRLGLDAPETWLVLARTLGGLGRLDEALSAFDAAIARRRNMAEAHKERAQLIWMRTGDADAALADIEREAQSRPDDAGLQMALVQAVEYAKDETAARSAAEAALARVPASPALMIATANLAAATGDPSRAVELAQNALRHAPGERSALIALAYGMLAAGDGQGASQTAMALLRAAPHDQHGLAVLATAWRLTGDSRYRQLYDYDSLVRRWSLQTPQGWADLPGYLSDLGQALRRRHPYQTHPFGQSVRQGSQLPDLLSSDEPAIQAFPQALAPVIDTHLDAVGPGNDPFRARNTGRWRIAGIWSVWLRPGGWHADHVHPQGWLSSACYIELPSAVGAGGQEGWIKFGEPGLPTSPKLEAERAVRPEPGTVVLFPSYMWHGTIPFTGEEPRLTIAFDIVPD